MEYLKEMWLRYPNLRLCQIIENAVRPYSITMGSDHGEHCIYFITDEKLRKSLKEFEKCLETGRL